MTIHVVFLQDLQQPLTDAMLVGAQDVVALRHTEKRNEVSEAEIEIPNPGLAMLQLTQFVAVIETPDGTVAGGKILFRAIVGKVPANGWGKRSIRIPLTCAPASHDEDLRAKALEVMNGAALPPWAVQIIPEPDPGVVAVAFAGTASATAWPQVKASAIRVNSFIQKNLVRTPFRYLSWTSLNVENAVLVLTLPPAAKPAALAAARSKAFALIGISGDTDPTHAVYRTSGLVMSVNDTVGGQVDVVINLADPSLVPAGVAVPTPADPTAAGLPQYEHLFSGSSTDYKTSALEGRAETWHFDPVSHAITLDPILAGVRTLDFAGTGDESSTEVGWAPSPARRVKLRIQADWTQRANGPVDVSPVIALAAGPGGSLTSLAPAVAEPAGDPKVDFQSWGGWTKHDWKTTRTIGRTASYGTGRTILGAYRDDTTYASFQAPGSETTSVNHTVPGPVWTMAHEERCSFNYYSFWYNSAWCTYDYSQQRNEVVDLVLDVDVQGVARGTETLELPTLTLNDVTAVTGVAAFAPGTMYNKGDKVLVRGRVYQCLYDGILLFDRPVWKRSFTQGLRLVVGHPDWLDLGTQAPLRDVRSPTYFDTDRGRATIEAALSRMRAAALKRLEMMSVTRTYPWTQARDVTLKDRVRMLLRDGHGQAKAVAGKVVAIERKIEKTATVKITIAVPFGTGRNDVVTARRSSYYGRENYFSGDYTVNNTPEWLADSLTSTATGIYAFGDDVEWALSSDPLVVPVDAFRLGDPRYAVYRISVVNQHGLQVSEALSRAWKGRDPKGVTRDLPTGITMAMRPMFQEPVQQRYLSVHAQLTSSPRGIVLASGDEP